MTGLFAADVAGSAIGGVSGGQVLVSISGGEGLLLLVGRGRWWRAEIGDCL